MNFWRKLFGGSLRKRADAPHDKIESLVHVSDSPNDSTWVHPRLPLEIMFPSGWQCKKESLSPRGFDLLLLSPVSGWPPTITLACSDAMPLRYALSDPVTKKKRSLENNDFRITAIREDIRVDGYPGFEIAYKGHGDYLAEVIFWVPSDDQENPIAKNEPVIMCQQYTFSLVSKNWKQDKPVFDKIVTSFRFVLPQGDSAHQEWAIFRSLKGAIFMLGLC